jgi:hypothetical protein
MLMPQEYKTAEHTCNLAQGSVCRYPCIMRCAHNPVRIARLPRFAGPES